MANFVSTGDVCIESDALTQASNNPGRPDGVAGLLAGTLAGSARQPQAEANPKPPLTNRGAEYSIPPENRSLLDWCAFTFKQIEDPAKVSELIGIDPALMTDCTFGFSGYRNSLKYGNVSIYYNGREGMGCHVEMSGQGCRQYEALFIDSPWKALFETVLANSGKFTRLDLAIDNVDGALNMDRIMAAILDHDSQIRTLFGEARRIQKVSFKTGQAIIGDTIYLGSAKSRLMIRIYNKALELGLDGIYLRVEIQLRDERAQEAAKLFVTDIDVGSLAVGIINNYFAIINDDDSNKSRCSLQSWWADWLQSAEKIKLSTEQAIKLVSDTMEFIRKQYAPSLAMINKHLGRSDFNSFVQEVLTDGSERMTAKHERILAASEAQGGSNE
ncbi:phage replication initiation protein [Trichlorobacter thiogenes]|uniref:Phage replication initiation protein n=1 Tax=Trichlorobacter thiogenes TaxID=115783 RepID=A0A1T4RB72_9BACT|nr:replication initiation factor domain-containing protein [Trichlorobacter thiogenes]SKA13284.1 phage replication initiation protein [Trichlorobacter thiogenes]